MTLPFGKYKGQEIESIPTAYLKWFEENVESTIQLREEINAEIKRRSSEESSVGKNVVGVSNQTFDELLGQHLITWLKNERTLGRINFAIDREEVIQVSLYTCLKREVPRLMKIWRAQKV